MVGRNDTLAFALGETTMMIAIQVKGDSRKEPNETFDPDPFGKCSHSPFRSCIEDTYDSGG